MTYYLKNIAVIDFNDRIHSVDFTKGLNIITGKSSTGKSALIEIFDYCFGNSDYTVPEGKITENAKLYFITFSNNSNNLILGRKPQESKVFFKEVSNISKAPEINIDFFKEEYFLPMKPFKETLGRFWGIDIEDTDVDLDDRYFRRNNAKNPRPSVRHFTSYMLQHQNLVANKHSLFYRFDEKEKREQTIDQFKIFTGFVDQEYFILKQRINETEKKLKNIVLQKNSLEKKEAEKARQLDKYLLDYKIISGVTLTNRTAKDLLSNPANNLDRIQAIDIITDIDSDEYLKNLKKLEKQLNENLANKRSLEIKLNNVEASIKNVNEYKNDLGKLTTVNEVQLYSSKCPFCHTINDELSVEANSLEEAIKWLNEELAKTPLLLDSLLPQKKALQTDIEEEEVIINQLNQEIKNILKIIHDLRKNKSIEEQTLRLKLKIENILEEKINVNLLDFQNKIDKLIIQKKELESKFFKKYNVDNELKKAQNYINKAMNKIGSNLDFEKYYKPINLNFSLDSFDLWHEKPGKKIFLRSMGSGANWLYSHIALFTSIHKYFCSIGEKSLIPPILFFDQPSQVYFPASIDNDEESFKAKELKEKENKTEKVDEDLNSVTNLFNQLVEFCNETKEETGIEPQIIITDHADNLILEGADFEALVNGRRWRKRGFIDISELNT